MKILDITENIDLVNDIKWLESQIKYFKYAILHFNNLVEIKGYSNATKESREKIELSKSCDWWYKSLSEIDNTIKSKQSMLISTRSQLEKLISSGLSYE